ncbi:hypothetical protein WNY58_16430 [Neptuniibacter pectenicola]|jgi:hypothetical protein|uniref:Uncharacterized protein n=1 Tax=Neptuniibacter pectenicola TaxID=1806669 RepID=A0ABU9TXT7_9GAMM|tara:strand:- start:6021 stop:6248 length:228 start_codon:yes stop_codon:yes gene_type:complete
MPETAKGEPKFQEGIKQNHNYMILNGFILKNKIESKKNRNNDAILFGRKKTTVHNKRCTNATASKIRNNTLKTKT